MAQRSRYPAVSLREAIEKVERIYEKEGPNAMSSVVAAQHMGYGGLNGASLTSLASLKKYGLVEGRGEDVRISSPGVIIVSDKKADDQAERRAALRAALVSDPLFRELDERFAGRTTEINVTSYLQKKGFAPSAARSAAKSYLESAAFVDQEFEGYDWRTQKAQDEPVMISAPRGAELSLKGSPPQLTENRADSQESPVVISGVPFWPTIKLPKPFTGKNWDDMIRMLDAMKGGLITSEPSSLTSIVTEPQGEDSDKTN